ncbi:hypothetical protein MHYP_G00224170 [Metynnis hypsauchen]
MCLLTIKVRYCHFKERSQTEETVLNRKFKRHRCSPREKRSGFTSWSENWEVTDFETKTKLKHLQQKCRESRCRPREAIGPDNTKHLRELLNKIGRQDLLGVIDTYEGEPDPAELPDEAELEQISIATNVIVDNLGKKWKEFGRKLRISDTKLDGIEEKHPRNLEEKVREVIKEWKMMRKGQAKVDELIKALRACSQNFTADVVQKALQNASTP